MEAKAVYVYVLCKAFLVLCVVIDYPVFVCRGIEYASVSD